MGRADAAAGHFNPDRDKLDQVVEDLGIDSIVLGGESTSGCVRASVVDAYSRGLPPVIVQECVFDRNPISHAINLFDMHHKYGHVTPLKEVTELLKLRTREQ